MGGEEDLGADGIKVVAEGGVCGGGEGEIGECAWDMSARCVDGLW